MFIREGAKSRLFFFFVGGDAIWPYFSFQKGARNLFFFFFYFCVGGGAIWPFFSRQKGAQNRGFVPFFVGGGATSSFVLLLYRLGRHLAEGGAQHLGFCFSSV